jgi:hypothetical protein
MTIKFTPQVKIVRAAVPPRIESPQLDERLWQAWLEKNRKRDKVKFARRVKVIAVLVVLVALAALFHGIAG